LHQRRAEDEVRRALKEVLGYRLYVDLRHGWRISSPNLEQCGLLQIHYRHLEDICADTDTWQGKASQLLSLNPQKRHLVSKTLLNHLRSELAIEINLAIQSMSRPAVALVCGCAKNWCDAD
jgi:hypothetical protein